jgi:hypothetical protein
MRNPVYTTSSDNCKAELIGADCAAALGIEAHGSSPVFALCRALVEAGHDPATPLEAYRGETLALRVESIGQAAKLRVAPHGVGFVLDTPADERQPRPFVKTVLAKHPVPRSHSRAPAKGAT